MANDRTEKLEAFGKLLDVIDILRVKCPWDAKQTNESLRPNTIEETMELCDALINDDAVNIKKELGDVLMHILFYSVIANEKGQFDIADVCNAIREKLIYRHPHIFGETKVNSAEEVLQNWEALKLKEKGGNKTVLAGVPKSLPSIIKAERIQEKTSNVGFDWAKKEDVWDKVKEEISEVEQEMKRGDNVNTEKEFGDLLFSVINAARLYGVRADNALELTNIKFTNRFKYIEQQALSQGKRVNELSLDEMDNLWNEAKNLNEQ